MPREKSGQNGYKKVKKSDKRNEE
jgi:hypothetical protein